MRALTWQGTRDVRVADVPDPKIEQPTDAIIKVTSTAICGSDLHLYEVMGAFLDAGDVLGHEPMGIVEEVGAEVTHIKPGDRGTISLSGVYGGAADPLPMLQMFDKQITLKMGQANVKHWIDELMPLLGDDDPLGVDAYATHHLPLEEAPQAYETFQKKADGAFKIVLKP